MLIGVATRKYARSVRLPDGDLAGEAKRATTKSSVSRRFVALSTAKLKEWLAADLSGLDLLVIQIDRLRVGDHVLVAAIGIDGAGDKHNFAQTSQELLNRSKPLVFCLTAAAKISRALSSLLPANSIRSCFRALLGPLFLTL
jgi:hypothetical protein